MTLEGWKSVFDIGAVLLLGLTFVFGAGALITGNRLNNIQSEKLETLEHDNLILRGKVAGLEIDADNAKAAQQRAEKDLLQLQERVKLRHLSPEQRKKLIDFLHLRAAAAVPKGPIRINRLIFDETAQAFAVEIKDAFTAGGWPSDDVGREMIPPGGTVQTGVVLIVHNAKNFPAHAGLIQHALIAADLKPTLGENANVPEGMVEILVGIKP